MVKGYKKGYNLKDGNQKGLREGGRGRNRTTKCRHPSIKNNR